MTLRIPKARMEVFEFEAHLALWEEFGAPTLARPENGPVLRDAALSWIAKYGVSQKGHIRFVFEMVARTDGAWLDASPISALLSATHGDGDLALQLLLRHIRYGRG
jgi:hypothetical protein